MQGALNAFEYNGAEQRRIDLPATLTSEAQITAGVSVGKQLAASLVAETVITSGLIRGKALAARLEAETVITIGLTKLTASSRGASVRRPYQGRSMRRVQSTREPTR